MDALLSVCQNAEERLIITLLSQTGLRASEACGLVISDINFEKRFIVVRYAKWGKTRRVGLPQQVADAISAFLLERPQVDHDFLLVDKKHQPLNRSGLLQRVQRLSIQAGFLLIPMLLGAPL